MNSKQEYTVFSRADYAFSDEMGYPSDLAGFIRVFAEEDPYNPPVAWMVGHACEPTWHRERDASIAAGRLIEKTASGWVALGAEKQENRLLTQEECLRNIQQIIDSVLRSDEPTSADLNAAMVLRDGPARIAIPKPRQLTVRVQSTAKPNPFARFKSPDCESGPSDHLNASRHQMAGMKG